MAGSPPSTVRAAGRRGERRGFSSLGTIDRITYGSYESLIALSGAAAVTQRIGLVTAVLVAPLRVGAGATIGAGSTITEDAPDGKLTLTRAKQTTVEGWQRPEKNDKR